MSVHIHRNRGWMSSSVMFSAYTMILENIHIPQVIEHWAIIAGWLSRYNTCTSAYCYIYHLIQVTLHQNNNRTSLCNTQPSFYGLCWIVINFPELNSSASFIQINTVTEASSFTHNHKNVSLSISVCPIRNMYTNPLVSHFCQPIKSWFTYTCTSQLLCKLFFPINK